MSADILWLDASELSSRFADRSLSPVEVTSAVLARAEAIQPVLNPFALVDERGAIAQARRAEARWAAGEPLSALDGVPVSIKDSLHVAGLPTRAGSLACEDAGPEPADSPAVARLREAGAVLFAKTTLPDHGYKIITDSPLTGVTRNPWDPSRTAGGSSGGAAAAVAAGAGPLAVGTDGGGSIRVPSAWTGLYGLKPSYGRVPVFPYGPFWLFAHTGPMARSVRDAALLMDVITRPDPRDWHALPYAEGTYDAGPTASLSGLRVAYTPDFGLAHAVDPKIAYAVECAVRLMSSLGAQVEEATPPADRFADVMRPIWDASCAALVRHHGDKAHLLDEPIRVYAEAGRALAADALFDSLVQRSARSSEANAFFAQYDLVVGPVTNVSAPVIDEIDPRDHPRPTFTQWCNVTGLPAASLPCGLTDEGLPVGLQIIGRPHGDALVLAASQAMETALGRVLLPLSSSSPAGSLTRGGAG